MLAIIRVRQLLVAMTVVLSGVLALPVFMRSAASATARANPGWAGWSAHPGRGTVTFVEARWRVPKVACDAPRLPFAAGAAVWAGLWGHGTDPQETWLPRAGTYSQCAKSNGRTVRHYEAVVEMFHAGSSAFTVLYGVHAGDIVFAIVEYTGTSQGRLSFWYEVEDENTIEKRQGFIYTSRNVPVADAAYQGGAMVERSGPGKDDPGSGLPKFRRIHLRLSVGQDPGLARSWAVQRWDLVSASGHHLATTGPFRNGRFTVSWDRYG